MRAGKLIHRVSIHRPARTTDAAGQPIEGTELVGRRWAAIEPLGGSESREVADQLVADATHRITLRAGGIEIGPECWIVHRGRRLNLVSVRDTEERGAELVATARELPKDA